MKKLYILIAVVIGIVFAANTHVLAKSSVDIELLKEEIKKELRAERPWNKDLQGWGVDIHGFISQGYMLTSEYNYLSNSKGGNFSYNEIGINFSKNLTNKLHIGVQLLSRDLGPLYNNDVEIDWAYADYRWKDWLGIRAGLLKVPLGLYNETRDIDSLRTFVLLPSGVYSETYREYQMGFAGIGIYGNLPLGAMGDMDYQLQAGTLNMANDGGVAQVYEDDVMRRFGGLTSDMTVNDLDVEENYVGSLVWRTPVDGLRLGGTVSYSTFVATVSGTWIAFAPWGAGSYTADFDSYLVRTFTLSGEYVWEDLIWAVEYWNNMTDTKSTWSLGPGITDVDTEREGWYSSLSYRVNDWLEVGTYYSMYWPDARDHEGDHHTNALTPDYKGWSEDIAISTRFDITPYSLIKMELHRMNGTGVVIGSMNGGSTTPATTYPDRKWWMFNVKMSFTF